MNQRKTTRLSRLISTLLFTICLSAPTFSQGKFVSTRKQQFIGPDGRVLHLKGINLGNWLLPEGYMFKFESASSPRLIETVINQLIGEDEARRFWNTYRNQYITRDDIQFIKRAGFNSVRVPFNYRLLVNPDTQKLEGVGYALLDRVVNWCKEAQLYVIFDLHAAPGGQTGDNIDDSFGYPYLFESVESQELTIKIWQTLAARYRDSTTVIGYDLLNEPIAHFFDIASLNPKLEPLYKRIVAAIRKVDPHHIIFLGGAQWDSNFKIFGPPFDDKLAYTFHKYWTEPTEQVIEEYVEFSKRYAVPLWMGESGENTDEWIATFRKVLEKNGIGWCFWPYKKLEASSCIVSIHQPADWQAIVTFAKQPRATFEEVRKVRPPKEQITRALNAYLEAVKFTNCRVNDDYLKALGLP